MCVHESDQQNGLVQKRLHFEYCVEADLNFTCVVVCFSHREISHIRKQYHHCVASTVPFGECDAHWVFLTCTRLEKE